MLSPFQCDICPYYFNWSHELVHHWKTVHQVQAKAQWKMFEFGGSFCELCVWSRPFPATSSSPSRANKGPAPSAQPWPMAYRPWALAELTRLGPFVDTGRLVRSSRKLPRDRVTVNQKSPPNSNVSLCVALGGRPPAS